LAASVPNSLPLAGDASGSAPVLSPVSTPLAEAPEVATEWSPAEQKLLEEALKTFPQSLGKERWTKISEAVGRSRRDCVERTKQLVTAVQMAKK